MHPALNTLLNYATRNVSGKCVRLKLVCLQDLDTVSIINVIQVGQLLLQTSDMIQVRCRILETDKDLKKDVQPSRECLPGWMPNPPMFDVIDAIVHSEMALSG